MTKVEKKQTYWSDKINISDTYIYFCSIVEEDKLSWNWTFCCLCWDSFFKTRKTMKEMHGWCMKDSRRNSKWVSCLETRVSLRLHHTLDSWDQQQRRKEGLFLSSLLLKLARLLFSLLFRLLLPKIIPSLRFWMRMRICVWMTAISMPLLLLWYLSLRLSCPASNSSFSSSLFPNELLSFSSHQLVMKKRTHHEDEPLDAKTCLWSQVSHHLSCSHRRRCRPHLLLT